MSESAPSPTALQESLLPPRLLGRWWRLALIVAFALPLLLWFLGTPHATDMMELFNLVPVREAAQDGHWLMPTLNGAPRLEKPPLPVWVPAGLAAVFGTLSLWLLRLPSILLAISACVATYLIGLRLSRDRVLGLVGALTLAGVTIFLRNSRVATYDIYAASFATWMLLGLVSLAEAAPRGWRRAGWIILTGVAAGLSILSKGPVPLATVALPVGLWMLIFHRKPRVWLDVLLAAVLAAAVALPWLVVIGQTYPDAWGMWTGEFVQFATSKPNMVGGTAAELRDPWYYYFQFFLWMMPFTPLFVGGLLVPVLPTESDPPPDALERRGRWLMWLIVVLGLVLLSVPSEKKPRYALQLIPAAALLVAIVWQEFSRLNPQVSIKAAAGFLLWCNQLLVAVAGLLLILAVLITGPLSRMWAAELGGFDRLRPLADLPEALRPALHTLTWPGAVVIGLALLGLSVLLQRAQTSRRFLRAASVYLIAAWLLNLAIVIGYYGSPAYHRDPAQGATAFMLSVADGQPIYTMDYRPWLPVLWDAGKILPEQSAETLIAQAQQRPMEPLYVVVPVSGWDDQPLRDIAEATGRSWQPRYVFSDGHRFIEMVVFFPK